MNYICQRHLSLLILTFHYNPLMKGKGILILVLLRLPTFPHHIQILMIPGKINACYKYPWFLGEHNLLQVPWWFFLDRFLLSYHHSPNNSCMHSTCNHNSLYVIQDWLESYITHFPNILYYEKMHLTNSIHTITIQSHFIILMSWSENHSQK